MASFQPDSRVGKMAEAYSLDAVDLAAKNFAIALDGSEASVERVEWVLGELHASKARTRPPEDTVWWFAKAFGSYVGEVLRRHHGGEWGTVRTGEESFPGIERPNGASIWPWGRAHNRLVNGPADNVWDYYRVIAGEIA